MAQLTCLTQWALHHEENLISPTSSRGEHSPREGEGKQSRCHPPPCSPALWRCRNISQRDVLLLNALPQLPRAAASPCPDLSSPQLGEHPGPGSLGPAGGQAACPPLLLQLPLSRASTAPWRVLVSCPRSLHQHSPSNEQGERGRAWPPRD